MVIYVSLLHHRNFRLNFLRLRFALLCCEVLLIHLFHCRSESRDLLLFALLLLFLTNEFLNLLSDR